MEQRHCGDSDGIIFVDNFVLRSDYVETDFVRSFTAEIGENIPELVSTLLKDVDSDSARLAKQGKGGQQTREAETMVAMQVADEDIIEAREFKLHAAHLQLGTFAAVNHEKVVADVEHLG
jgi:hypothetical protein